MEKSGLAYQGTVTVTDRRLHIPRDVVWYALNRPGRFEAWRLGKCDGAARTRGRHPGFDDLTSLL